MHLEIGDTSTPANRLATVLAEGLGPDHPALADLAAVLLDRSKDDEIARLRAQVEALQGLRPEIPQRPPHSNDSRYQHPALKRYGLRWNGPGQPVSVPMEDGYWTPFHAALAEVEALRASRGELLEVLRVVVRDWTEQFERHGSLAPEWCKQARAAITKSMKKTKE